MLIINEHKTYLSQSLFERQTALKDYLLQNVGLTQRPYLHQSGHLNLSKSKSTKRFKKGSNLLFM